FALAPSVISLNKPDKAPNIFKYRIYSSCSFRLNLFHICAIRKTSLFLGNHIYLNFITKSKWKQEKSKVDLTLYTVTNSDSLASFTIINSDSCFLLIIFEYISSEIR